MDQFAASEGFVKSPEFHGLHLDRYVQSPGLSINTYHGDTKINVTMWKSHSDRADYKRQVAALRAIFLPLGFHELPPNDPSRS